MVWTADVTALVALGQLVAKVPTAVPVGIVEAVVRHWWVIGSITHSKSFQDSTSMRYSSAKSRTR
jgi:hypothetical protein